MHLKYIVKNNELNINQILQNKLNISSRLLFKLIKKEKVLLNGCVCDTRTYPNFGDELIVNFDYDEENSNIVPTKMDLNIVFEDNWMLIVNKPAGVATHPSILHYYDSLCNGVRFYFDSIGLNKKVRPVNRLDLNTSGLVIFAKCEYIQECLISEMKNNIFKKEYLAFCEGLFENKSGTIDLPIGRKDNSIIERCILETGRTHQIRVHLSAISHPLIGDSLYGSFSDLISRQALHCYKLQFIHPITKEFMSFCGDLPPELKKLEE